MVSGYSQGIYSTEAVKLKFSDNTVATDDSGNFMSFARLMSLAPAYQGKQLSSVVLSYYLNAPADSSVQARPLVLTSQFLFDIIDSNGNTVWCDTLHLQKRAVFRGGVPYTFYEKEFTAQRLAEISPDGEYTLVGKATTYAVSGLALLKSQQEVKVKYSVSNGVVSVKDTSVRGAKLLSGYIDTSAPSDLGNFRVVGMSDQEYIGLLQDLNGMPYSRDILVSPRQGGYVPIAGTLQAYFSPAYLVQDLAHSLNANGKAPSIWVASPVDGKFAVSYAGISVESATDQAGRTLLISEGSNIVINPAFGR